MARDSKNSKGKFGELSPAPWRLGVAMRKLDWNWPAWAGFLLSILAFVSYFMVFARFPITRNVPWVNFLLFGVAALFFLTGLKRVFTGAGSLACWRF